MMYLFKIENIKLDNLIKITYICDVLIMFYNINANYKIVVNAYFISVFVYIKDTKNIVEFRNDLELNIKKAV